MINRSRYIWIADSDCRACHLAAFCRAVFAGVCTGLAMVHLEFPALGSTGFANIRTNSTNLLCKLRAATRVRRGRPANLSAVLVESNALGHFGQIAFTEAGIRAMFALLGASHARFDTGLILVMGHDLVSVSCKCLDRSTRLGNSNNRAHFVVEKVGANYVPLKVTYDQPIFEVPADEIEMRL
jgi:hypothetical protein